MKRHVFRPLISALLLLLLLSAPVAASGSLGPQRTSSSDADLVQDDHWALTLGLGYGSDAGGRPVVSPNGVALSAGFRYHFGSTPIFLGFDFDRLLGTERNIDEQTQERSRLHLGPVFGVYGELGDFELQLAISAGPLLELGNSLGSHTEADFRAFLAPSATLLRPLSPRWSLGVTTSYVVVTREVDALVVQAAVACRL